MVYSTKGIVLRSVKYGETSLIVSIFTERFGLQSYLINGVRTVSRKGAVKAGLFQPGAILDLVVYHNELKNLQRVKEFKWGFLYEHIFTDVRKNAVSLFMIELLQKSVKQPESNQEFYFFVENALTGLDRSEGQVLANYPLYFALQLLNQLGWGILDDYSLKNQFLDLEAGSFTDAQPTHPHFLGEPFSRITSDLLKVKNEGELEQVRLNQETRRALTQAYQHFYAMHIEDFSSLRSLPVLQILLG
jgi:DNA repair protein RecO (recombination protein O)